MSNLANSPPLPDWAIQHARASLRIGMKVPEIEQRLVAHGLSSEAATSVVTKALEDRIREENKERARRRLCLHRISSAALVGEYIVIIAFRTGEVRPAIYALGGFLFPLACIWFGDEVGWATGLNGLRPYITFSTPGPFVRLVGWLVWRWFGFLATSWGSCNFVFHV